MKETRRTRVAMTSLVSYITGTAWSAKRYMDMRHVLETGVAVA